MAIRQQTTYQRYLLDIVALYQTHPDLKAYLELLLSIFTIILFALFAIRPTLVTIGQLLTQINEKKQTLAALTKKADDLATAQNLLQKDSELVTLLDTAVPQKPLPAQFIRQVEGLAQKDQVQLVNSRLGETPLAQKNPTPSGNTNANLEVTITAQSTTYDALNTFTKDLENLLRPIAAENVAQEITKINEVTFNLTYTGLVPYIPQ